eukprot:gnl/Ergobibamus_cyprinoides/1831.p3 GENE.gnl/Ergobibamus_cyprinoides/1831~~gnl/Ergobibamus_cyprinoides/1831.p3  ORF type:complete len:221 (+),score=85.72 gnl/Ergobibamus_cyprinoides/1831:228-890(+)
MRGRGGDALEALAERDASIDVCPQPLKMPGLSRKDDELRRQQLLAVLAPAVARAVATEPADEDASEDDAVPLCVALLTGSREQTCLLRFLVAHAVARVTADDVPDEEIEAYTLLFGALGAALASPAVVEASGTGHSCAMALLASAGTALAAAVHAQLVEDGQLEAGAPAEWLRSRRGAFLVCALVDSGDAEVAAEVREAFKGVTVDGEDGGSKRLAALLA